MRMRIMRLLLCAVLIMGLVACGAETATTAATERPGRRDAEGRAAPTIDGLRWSGSMLYRDMLRSGRTMTWRDGLDLIKNRMNKGRISASP